MIKNTYERGRKFRRVWKLSGDGEFYAKTRNMYPSARGSESCLESFPGYRKLAKLPGRINGIYPADFGSEYYLIHAGAALYSCQVYDNWRDLMNFTEICTMKDCKSFGYRWDDKIYIFDGGDVTVIGNDFAPKKLYLNPDLAYIPTTYLNGEEAEQINILSDSFYERYDGLVCDDLTFESEGLIYNIKSEKDATCSVVGLDENFSDHLFIPCRKKINGKYYRVVEIADRAFMNHKGITRLIASKSVERIGISALQGCTSLFVAVLQNGIKEIAARAFDGCVNLEKVYIGVTCESIYFNAFDSCSSITNVYFSGADSEIIDCDGVGNMMNFPVTYNTKYTGFYLGIPVMTPVAEIAKVTIDGKTVVNKFIRDRNLIKIPHTDSGEYAGRTLVIEGNIDRTISQNSERRVAFSDICSKSSALALYGATGGKVACGRAMIFCPEDVPSVILASSYTMSGETHPLYFGELDYIQVGNSNQPIEDIAELSEKILVSKPKEKSGSIFILSPSGKERVVFGSTFDVEGRQENTLIKSGFGIYGDEAVFLTEQGIKKLALSGKGFKISSISKGASGSVNSTYGTGAIFSRLGDLIAIFCNGKLLLGDEKNTKKIDGEEQYRWYPIFGVGSFIGEQTRYYFSDYADDGLYLHPDIGMPAEGTVYSYMNDEGKMVYYVKISGFKYAVTPSEEVLGGELSSVTSLCYPIYSGDETFSLGTLIFGGEGGDVFALNTDKVGIPPRSAYEKEDFDLEKYTTAWGDRIHPDFYTHAGHRVEYLVATPMDYGEISDMVKNDLRDGLTVKLSSVGKDEINVLAATDSEIADARGYIESESAEILANINSGDFADNTSLPLGGMDFGDVDFAFIDMGKKEIENITVTKNRKKWLKKQIIVYTNKLKTPFAIYEVSYGFSAGGRNHNT